MQCRSMWGGSWGVGGEWGVSGAYQLPRQVPMVVVTGSAAPEGIH